MKIYLAGPEVFLKDPHAAGASLKEICKAHDATGLFPMDNDIPAELLSSTATTAPTKSVASWIREKNMEMIRGCDGIIANMTPFRGVSMDVGTAYEMGVASALGKIVVGYSSDQRTYVDKVVEAGEGAGWGKVTRDSQACLRDGLGNAVEEFPGEPLVDNLMLACGVDNPGFVVCGSAEEAVKLAVGLFEERRTKG